MNVVYAESSAVLAWLLKESRELAITREFSAAEKVVASKLTVIECSRALARGRTIKQLTEAEELAGRQLLEQAASSWYVLDVTDRVAARAKGSFPHEPVRTLDALHLATAELFAEVLGDVRVLSLDDRVRRNATAMGLSVSPDE